MALSREERAYMLAALEHDELTNKLAGKAKVSDEDAEKLRELEVNLFNARSAQRKVVSAQLQTMEGTGDADATDRSEK